MNTRIAFTTAAILALAACGGSDQPAAEATAAATAAAAAPASEAAPAAPAAGAKPSKEFVVGKWGTDGDCEMAMDLRADGTSDGPFGNWTYADGVLSFADAPEMQIQVTVIDEKTMASRNDGGQPKKMTRC